MSESVASAAPVAAPAPAAADPKAAAPAVDGKTPPAGAAPADATAAIAKRKVKVDGAEVEVSDEDLVKGFQLEGTARKRLAEATAKLNEAKGLEAKLKAGGEDALRAAGWSDQAIEELSIKILSAKHASMLEQERLKAMDPKERENLELKKKLKDLDDAAAKTKDEQQKAHVQNVTRQISNAVIETLQIFPEGMRQSPLLADRCLSAWESALTQADELQAKGVTISPKWISDQVMDELRGLSTGLLTHAKDDELEKLLPSTVRARMAKKTGHPELGAKSIVREKKPAAEEGEKKPRVTQGQLLRRVMGPRGNT